MFAMIRTRIADAGCAVFDTLFFRRRLKRHIHHLNYLNAELNYMNDRMAEKVKALNTSEESARAQLMQLRVHQESVEHRTGFMVSAFVPTGVIKRLTAGTAQQRLNFQMRVSKLLVEYALKGLYRVSTKGTMTAMIFEPLSLNSNKRSVTPIFETHDGKHTAEVSAEIRQIRDGEQKLLRGENL